MTLRNLFHSRAALGGMLLAAVFAAAASRSCAQELPPPDPAALLMPTDEATATAAAPADKLDIPENYPRICRRFANLVEARHLLQKKLGPSAAAQAWTNFLGYLDYDRSYFLQSDIATLLPYRDTLAESLRKGDLEFPVKAFKLFRQRVVERAEYVDKLLDEGFDFSVDEEYTWKRKELPWPADQAEQDDLWRRRIKNELLARLVSRDFAVSNDTAKAASTNAVAQGLAEAHHILALKTPDSPASASEGPGGQPPDPLATNAPAADLSPEAFIRKRYRQYRIIIEDADAEWVLQRFLTAFASTFDPHTDYMAPAASDNFNIEMNLSLCGIGATLMSEDGTAKVTEIIPGSPASRDTRDIRLRKGDKIIGVGQGDGPIEDIVHQPLDKIVKRIRGKKGTKVVLHVISASDPSGGTTRKIDLIRDDIKLEEQAATGRVVRVSCPLRSPSIPPAGGPGGLPPDPLAPRTRAFGVVRLPTFYGSMTSDFRDPNFRSCTYDIMRIVARMNAEIEGLVLDLRGNGGGSLREAVTLAGSFFRTGPVVLVQEIGNTQVLPDQDPAINFRKPMVVLVDRASASASEIVAAALQDYGRAVIIGDHMTHGKGSVQTVMPLIASDPSYGSMRLTIAKFFRINGGSTQLRGVESDIVIPSTLEYLDIGEDKLPNAMPWTQIPPARYRPVYPLAKHIPGLATNAYARLATNEEYQAHLRLVNHVKEVSERTTVPLSYEKRYALYAAEDALNHAMNRYDGEDEDDEDDDSATEGGSGAQPPSVVPPASTNAPASSAGGPGGSPSDRLDDGIGRDIVLRAALDVLSDLVDIQGANAISPASDTGDNDWLFRFFQ